MSLPDPMYPFASQTIIVTGSNTGLGFDPTKYFIRLNASKVILAVRTVSRGEAAKFSIESLYSQSQAKIISGFESHILKNVMSTD